MKWFFNLHTKVKLVLLSGFLILSMITLTITGYMVSMKNVFASENISVVLTRSYERVYAASFALQKLDNDLLIFLSRDAGEGMRETQQFIDSAHQGLNNFIETVSLIRENNIGDMESTPQYRDRVLKLKQTAKEIDQRSDGVFSKLYEDRYATFQAYLHDLRPLMYDSVVDFAFLNTEQIKRVMDLANAGASMTPMYISFSISIGATIFGLLMSVVIGRYITQSIQQQEYFMTEMSYGHFDFDIPSYHKDDFGLIIDKIKVMRDNLNNALTQVLKDTEKTQDSLSKVSQASLNIVHESEDCQSKTLTVAAATEEMTSTNLDIARNCEEASSFSNTTKNLIDQGVGMVQNSINSIRTQRTLIQNNSVSVDKVAKRSMDINAIVSTIEEIASQTNLLALNAAIEAARAGSSGRGFAVVADEVRALASRTASSTKEIAKMVSDIQQDAAEALNQITETVASMERTSQETEAVENTMHEIVEHVDSVTAQITQIASAAEEQTAASSEISTNIHIITTSSEEISKSAHSNDEIISQTVANLDSLKHSLSVFRLKR